MPIYALGDDVPDVHPEAYVHPEATLIGRVHIGAESTVWPTVIGDECVVGHNAHLEGCTVHDRCLIGSGSVVLNRAVVGRGSVVGAQALVPEDCVVAPETMALGVPARMRPLDPAEQAGWIDAAVREYVDNGRRFSTELRLIPQESSTVQGARP